MSKKKDRIVDVLMDYFDYIYCDNCKFQENNECDDCHRKAMGWELGKDYANTVAKAILKNLGE